MKLVKVKMLKNDKGASDGFTVQTYEKDKEYDVSEDLADAFLSTDSCVEIEGDSPSPREAKKAAAKGKAAKK